MLTLKDRNNNIVGNIHRRVVIREPAICTYRDEEMRNSLKCFAAFFAAMCLVSTGIGVATAVLRGRGPRGGGNTLSTSGTIASGNRIFQTTASGTRKPVTAVTPALVASGTVTGIVPTTIQTRATLSARASSQALTRAANRRISLRKLSYKVS